MKRTFALMLIAVLGTVPAIAGEARPLGDVVPVADVSLGDPVAPVLIEEYASMTCSHCARFANEVLPLIEVDYVFTGKARYVLKPLPIDPVAQAVSIVARCVGDDYYYPITARMFATQAEWVRDGIDRVEAITTILADYGVDRAKLDSCFSDRSVLAWMVLSSDAAQAAGISKTPTFVINGKIYEGAMPYEAMAAAIDAAHSIATNDGLPVPGN